MLPIELDLAPWNSYLFQIAIAWPLTRFTQPPNLRMSLHPMELRLSHFARARVLYTSTDCDGYLDHRVE